MVRLILIASNAAITIGTLIFGNKRVRGRIRMGGRIRSASFHRGSICFKHRSIRCRTTSSRKNGLGQQGVMASRADDARAGCGQRA